ncbi:hypothetical protein ACFRKD_34895 [Streptomyces niveus]|uniref:hypothetical protein n=1 Tax=Streptomyces niveus TaxID=193462 RepID=UPI00369CA0F2
MLDEVDQVPFAFFALAGDALERVVEVREVVVARTGLLLRGEQPQLRVRAAVCVSEAEVGRLAAGLGLEVPAGFFGFDEQGMLGLFGGVALVTGAFEFPLAALQAKPGLVQAGLGLGALEGVAVVPPGGEFAYGVLGAGAHREQGHDRAGGALGELVRPGQPFGGLHQALLDRDQFTGGDLRLRRGAGRTGRLGGGFLAQLRGAGEGLASSTHPRRAVRSTRSRVCAGMIFEPLRYSAHSVLLPGKCSAKEAVVLSSIRAPRPARHVASSFAFGPPFNFLGRPGPPIARPPVLWLSAGVRCCPPSAGLLPAPIHAASDGQSDHSAWLVSSRPAPGVLRL